MRPAFKTTTLLKDAHIGLTMAYVIFEIPKEKESELEILKKDDLISRQSLTFRDARSLGLVGDVVYVKIEGSEEALKRAQDMVEEHQLGDTLNPADARPISDKIRDEEESASEGMGMIFG